MAVQTILVHIADHKWTSEAVYQACLLAEETSARIVLVQMIPVQYSAWLGTDLGYINLTDDMQAQFEEYQAVVEDFGIECLPLRFQYADLTEALVQAAEHVSTLM